MDNLENETNDNYNSLSKLATIVFYGAVVYAGVSAPLLIVREHFSDIVQNTEPLVGGLAFFGYCAAEFWAMSAALQQADRVDSFFSRQFSRILG